MFISRFFECQKNQIASVIIKYNVVQTGANTQSGGFNPDLIKLEYQGSLDDIVAIPPIKEAEYVTTANIMKDKNLFLNIKVLYNIPI